jgi:hypothetical protein
VKHLKRAGLTWKGPPRTNTPAYYENSLNYGQKSFIASTPEDDGRVVVGVRRAAIDRQIRQRAAPDKVCPAINYKNFSGPKQLSEMIFQSHIFTNHLRMLFDLIRFKVSIYSQPKLETFNYLFVNNF